MKPPQPVVIDGFIYLCATFFGVVGADLGTDDAAKYVPAATLFFAKTFANAIAGSALALKMFRSTAYADHKRGDTQVFTKP